MTTIDTKKMEFHELSYLFPLMSEAEIDNLAEDIRLYGQRETIKVCEGKILDGRARYKACLYNRMEPKFEEINSDCSHRYIVSLNSKRKHLKESQRAWIASSLLSVPGFTQYDAACAMGVSLRTLSMAHKIKRMAIPELIVAVRDGLVTVNAAMKIAKFTVDQQHYLLKLDARRRKFEITRIAREMRLQSEEEQKKKREREGEVFDVVVHFNWVDLQKIKKVMRTLNYGSVENLIESEVMGFCEHATYQPGNFEKEIDRVLKRMFAMHIKKYPLPFQYKMTRQERYEEWRAEFEQSSPEEMLAIQKQILESMTPIKIISPFKKERKLPRPLTGLII